MPAGIRMAADVKLAVAEKHILHPVVVFYDMDIMRKETRAPVISVTDLWANALLHRQPGYLKVDCYCTKSDLDDHVKSNWQGIQGFNRAIAHTRPCC